MHNQNTKQKIITTLWLVEIVGYGKILLITNQEQKKTYAKELDLEHD